MERNVLFNDALNTFHLRFPGVVHMVKERGPLLPLYGLPFDWQQRIFYKHHPIDRITHNTVFVMPGFGALAGTRNSLMRDRLDDPSHHERTLYHGATSRSHQPFCVHEA